MCKVCLLALQIYGLHKQPVPDIQEEKKAFVEKLLEFNVSIQQYINAYKKWMTSQCENLSLNHSIARHRYLCHIHTYKYLFEIDIIMLLHAGAVFCPKGRNHPYRPGHLHAF